MKNIKYAFIAIFLIILLLPLDLARPNENKNDNRAPNEAPVNSDDANGTTNTDIINTPIADLNTKKSKIISQTKTAEVYCGEMNKYNNTFTLEISYSDGKKSFLKFRGRQYKLRIVYDDENDHIEYAIFTFADTSEADKSINVKYDLGKRPNKEIKEELKRWFDLAIAFLEKENPKADQQLIDIFDLRPFYEEYVKPFIAQQLNK